MIYRNNDIPKGYNKLAEISDNYLVWVRESTLSSGTSYNAYIQFLEPSWSVLFTEHYKIKAGDNYRLDANYSNNGMYSYLDNYDVTYSLNTIAVADEDIVSDDNSRPDMPNIFICQFICLIIYVWLINQLTKIVKKGGVFGND